MKKYASLAMLQRSKRVNGRSHDRSRAGGKRKCPRLQTAKPALERSFEKDIRLGPERKMELANTLDLEPRQVAIWFQNKRARSKVKQLEEQYELLKTQFHALQSDYNLLAAPNELLEDEILALKNREASSSGQSSSDIALLTINQKLEDEILALRNRESSGSGPNSPEKETMGSVIKNGDDDHDQNNCDVNLDTIVSPAAIDSTPYDHPSITELEYMFCSPLFGPPITSSVNPVLFQGSSSAAMEHQMLADESLMYMFSGEDQESLWWWAEQQQQGLFFMPTNHQCFNNQP